MPATIPAPPPAVRNRAFVTFLMCNDSYLPGCLMTAYGLARQGSRSQRVCVVTPEVSATARTALSVLYDRVVEVGRAPLPGGGPGPGDRPRTGSARVLDAALTRFSVLRLGRDGDLGCAYDKVVMLDADLLPLRDFESLWALPAPAGIVNERREHMAEIDRTGRLVVRPESLATGRWVWHEVYGATCPHGTPVPAEITDRVAVDHDNYGINASLLVLEPSMSAYHDFLRWVGSDGVRDLVRARWRWTDQQAATLYWSGRWCSVDPSYSTLYGYPTLRLARGLHFAGVKPWAWRRKGFARRIQRFPDHRLWAEVFVEMLEGHPALARHRGLGRLAREIGAALGPAATTRRSPAQAFVTPAPPRELRPARAARRSQGSSSTPGPRRRRTSA